MRGSFATLLVSLHYYALDGPQGRARERPLKDEDDLVSICAIVGRERADHLVEGALKPLLHARAHVKHSWLRLTALPLQSEAEDVAHLLTALAIFGDGYYAALRLGSR